MSLGSYYVITIYRENLFGSVILYVQASSVILPETAYEDNFLSMI